MSDLTPPPAFALSEGCLSEAEVRFERRRRKAGLVLGPIAFALLLAFPPPSLGTEAEGLLAVVAWVLVWWITEAVSLPMTAFLGPALTVVLGVVPAREAFAPFGDPIVFSVFSIFFTEVTANTSAARSSPRSGSFFYDFSLKTMSIARPAARRSEVVSGDPEASPAREIM